MDYKITGFLTTMFFGILIGTEKLHYFQSKTDFVILTDKVGDPALMTIFRVDPDRPKEKDPNYCSVGGDVLRRYHYTDSYRIFGKTFWQDCFEMYMPVKLVSLYPDMNYWPFRKDDLKPGDPNYYQIMELTKSQR